MVRGALLLLLLGLLLQVTPCMRSTPVPSLKAGGSRRRSLPGVACWHHSGAPHLRNILSSSGWKSMAVTKSVCLQVGRGGRGGRGGGGRSQQAPAVQSIRHLLTIASIKPGHAAA